MLDGMVTRLSFGNGRFWVAILEIIGGLILFLVAIQNHILPSILPAFRGLVTRRQIQTALTCPCCSASKKTEHSANQVQAEPSEEPASRAKAKPELPPLPLRSRPGTAEKRRTGGDERRPGLRRRSSTGESFDLGATQTDFSIGDSSSSGKAPEGDKAWLLVALEEAREDVAQLQAELDGEREAAEAAAGASLSLVQKLHREKFELQLKVNNQQRQLESDIASPAAVQSLNVIVTEQDSLMSKMEEEIERYKLAVELMLPDVNAAKLTAMRKQGLLGDLWPAWQSQQQDRPNILDREMWSGQESSGWPTYNSGTLEQVGTKDGATPGEGEASGACSVHEPMEHVPTLNDVDGVSPAKRQAASGLF